MTLPPSLFWVTWSSLDGAAASTLHPASVELLVIGVREKLKAQLNQFGATLTPPELHDRANPEIGGFQRAMLFPNYRYDDIHARDAYGKATDRLLTRGIAPGPEPQPEAAKSCNGLLARVLADSEAFDAREHVVETARTSIGKPPPRLKPAYRYDATPAEDALLRERYGQQTPECRVFLTSRGVDLMRAARHLFPAPLVGG